VVYPKKITEEDIPREFQFCLLTKLKDVHEDQHQRQRQRQRQRQYLQQHQYNIHVNAFNTNGYYRYKEKVIDDNH
jgi:hypothetical protein